MTALHDESAPAASSGSVASTGVSGFSAAHGVTSEYAYKRRAMREGTIMYHAHIGLSTWDATRSALQTVVGELGEEGHTLDRFGLCLDRAMSFPEDQREGIGRETGPLLTADEWRDVGQQSMSQAHMGDFMIGTAASFENSTRALANGVTTIGNLGQFFAFDVPGGGDAPEITRATVEALENMAAARATGALVHSYLDDGPAMQLSNYATYLGWAALESHVVETMMGARLAHCFGGLVPQPRARALLALAMPHIHEPDSVGSMVYGNTVDYTKDLTRNETVLTNYLLVDIATQLHRPTGHAVLPVPLTENIRIPDAADILRVQQLARGVEAEARRSGDLFDWQRLEAEAFEGAQYAKRWAARALEVLAEDGVDVTRPYDILLALRKIDMPKLEARVGLTGAPEGLGTLEPWKAETSREILAGLRDGASPRLDGRRIVVASMDVHDMIRDVVIKLLMSLGADVIALPADSHADAVVAAAVSEDVDSVIVSTYNGAALRHAREITDAARERRYDGAVYMGGVLNEDTGGEIPVDVSEQIGRLGVVCVDEVGKLPRLLAAAA